MRYTALLVVAVLGVGAASFVKDRILDRPVAIPPAAPGAAANAPRPIKENVVAFEKRDPAMNEAKQKAKATLARFRELYARRSGGTYTVKFPLTQNGATEHIWLQLTSMRDAEFVGLLANDPVNGTSYRKGQAMTVPANLVEDWMVNNNGEIYGGYTARVALAQLPKDQQAKYAGMFRD